MTRERLLAGLPVAERRLEVGGVSTVLLEGGDGPPLILLHGGIECGGVYWAPVIAQLAQSHRVVVPDVPGLGESAPLARLDAASFDDWFAALVGLTCEEQPTLVAHSLLGSLAARFAVRHGGLLRRLVIYGTPGIGPFRLPLGLRVALIRSSLRPTERNLERFLPWAFRDPERFEAFSSYMLSRARVRHVKRAMRQLVKAGLRRVPDDDMKQIEVPTALLWGRHDRMTPVSLGEHASKELGWPLHVVEDAGHVPHMECPDAFVVALQAMLRGRSVSADVTPQPEAPAAASAPIAPSRATR